MQAGAGGAACNIAALRLPAATCAAAALRTMPEPTKTAADQAAPTTPGQGAREAKQPRKSTDEPVGWCQSVHWIVLALVFGMAVVFKPSAQLQDIPGDVPGAPVVGHAIELSGDSEGAEGFLAGRCERYGTVSRLFLMGSDVVLLCGAGASGAELFLDRESVTPMSRAEVRAQGVGTLGGGGAGLPFLHTADVERGAQRVISESVVNLTTKSNQLSKLQDACRRTFYYDEKEERRVLTNATDVTAHLMGPLVTHMMMLLGEVRTTRYEAQDWAGWLLEMQSCHPLGAHLGIPGHNFVSCYAAARRFIGKYMEPRVREVVEAVRADLTVPATVVVADTGIFGRRGGRVHDARPAACLSVGVVAEH
jgi:hypothetical protein